MSFKTWLAGARAQRAALYAFPTRSGEREGMTLRDYFAAQAMRGFNSEMVRYEWGENVLDKAASMAYRIADAMLAERGR